jgi:hypothetical protein
MPTLAKKARVAAVAVLGCLAPALLPTPASAVPPQAEEIATLASIFPDFDNDLIGFLNISREDFCAWIDDGAEGPPPLKDPVSPAWVHERGDGGIGAVATDTLYLELWRLDDGAPAEDACADTSDSTAPLGVGTADIIGVDHLFEFIEHGAIGAQWNFRAQLTGPDGANYRYQYFGIELHNPDGTVRHDDMLRTTLVALP